MAEKAKKYKAPPPVADINVTPMVDVMLVMLIIFMVITPMLSKGRTVELAKTKNPIPMQAADKISTGDFDVPEFKEKGGDEVAVLGSSFNRMRRSLEKAMQMIGDQ